MRGFSHKRQPRCERSNYRQQPLQQHQHQHQPHVDNVTVNGGDASGIYHRGTRYSQHSQYGYPPLEGPQSPSPQMLTGYEPQQTYCYRPVQQLQDTQLTAAVPPAYPGTYRPMEPQPTNAQSYNYQQYEPVQLVGSPANGSTTYYYQPYNQVYQPVQPQQQQVEVPYHYPAYQPNLINQEVEPPPLAAGLLPTPETSPPQAPSAAPGCQYNYNYQNARVVQTDSLEPQIVEIDISCATDVYITRTREKLVISIYKQRGSDNGDQPQNVYINGGIPDKPLPPTSSPTSGVNQDMASFQPMTPTPGIASVEISQGPKEPAVYNKELPRTSIVNPQNVVEKSVQSVPGFQAFNVIDPSALMEFPSPTFSPSGRQEHLTAKNCSSELEKKSQSFAGKETPKAKLTDKRMDPLEQFRAPRRVSQTINPICIQQPIRGKSYKPEFMMNEGKSQRNLSISKPVIKSMRPMGQQQPEMIVREILKPPPKLTTQEKSEKLLPEILNIVHETSQKQKADLVSAGSKLTTPEKIEPINLKLTETKKVSKEIPAPERIQSFDKLLTKDTQSNLKEDSSAIQKPTELLSQENLKSSLVELTLPAETNLQASQSMSNTLAQVTAETSQLSSILPAPEKPQVNALISSKTAEAKADSSELPSTQPPENVALTTISEPAKEQQVLNISVEENANTNQAKPSSQENAIAVLGKRKEPKPFQIDPKAQLKRKCSPKESPKTAKQIIQLVSQSTNPTASQEAETTTTQIIIPHKVKNSELANFFPQKGARCIVLAPIKSIKIQENEEPLKLNDGIFEFQVSQLTAKQKPISEQPNQKVIPVMKSKTEGRQLKQKPYPKLKPKPYKTQAKQKPIEQSNKAKVAYFKHLSSKIHFQKESALDLQSESVSKTNQSKLNLEGAKQMDPKVNKTESAIQKEQTKPTSPEDAKKIESNANQIKFTSAKGDELNEAKAKLNSTEGSKHQESNTKSIPSQKSSEEAAELATEDKLRNASIKQNTNTPAPCHTAVPAAVAEPAEPAKVTVPGEPAVPQVAKPKAKSMKIDDLMFNAFSESEVPVQPFGMQQQSNAKKKPMKMSKLERKALRRAANKAQNELQAMQKLKKSCEENLLDKESKKKKKEELKSSEPDSKDTNNEGQESIFEPELDCPALKDVSDPVLRRKLMIIINKIINL